MSLFNSVVPFFASLVVTLISLLGSVGILDGSCSMFLLLFLTLDNVASELFPQVLELSVVLLDVVGVVDNQNVFLVALTSLDSPVE